MIRQIRSWQRNLHSWTVKRYFIRAMEQRAEIFAQRFENFLKPGSRILDIGGAWGFYFDPLFRRGHFLTVLDVARSDYHRAPTILYDSNERFPLPDQSVDASLIITMLHHTPDPGRILEEAKRVTRDVIIVVEDLYRNSLGRAWTILRDQIYNFEYLGHPKQFRSKKGWLELFRNKGFKLLHEEEMRTKLAGMGILNGLFILKANAHD